MFLSVAMVLYLECKPFMKLNKLCYLSFSAKYWVRLPSGLDCSSLGEPGTVFSASWVYFRPLKTRIWPPYRNVEQIFQFLNVLI